MTSFASILQCPFTCCQENPPGKKAPCEESGVGIGLGLGSGIFFSQEFFSRTLLLYCIYCQSNTAESYFTKTLIIFVVLYTVKLALYFNWIIISNQINVLLTNK